MLQPFHPQLSVEVLLDNDVVWKQMIIRNGFLIIEIIPESGICHKETPTGLDFLQGTIN